MFRQFTIYAIARTRKEGCAREITSRTMIVVFHFSDYNSPCTASRIFLLLTSYIGNIQFISEMMLSGEVLLGNSRACKCKYLSEGKGNIDDCNTIALHRSFKRATAVIPPHYRRICGNGILIERCLLSLNAMARVTASALQTRHGC